MHRILLILEHYKVGFPSQGLDSETKRQQYTLKIQATEYVYKNPFSYQKSSVDTKNYLHILKDQAITYLIQTNRTISVMKDSMSSR